MRSAILAITTTLLLSTAAAYGGGNSESSSEPARCFSSGAAATKLPQGSEPFPVDPADFTTKIVNPYWPMKPGSRWIFRETDAEGSVSRVVVTVLDKTKTISPSIPGSD